MKLIKLTNDGKTKNNTKWEIGKTISISNDKRRPELCSDGVLHAYESIEQALAMKQCHGYNNDKSLKIFEVEGNIEVKDYNKVGSYELTPIKEVALLDWYLNKDLRKKIIVRFSCYCALEVIDIFEKKYPNDNRPRKAIEEAMKYGSDEFDMDAAADAAHDAAYAVARAARAAAHAADAAYYAADAAADARASRASRAAAHAAYAARAAADAAIYADDAAHDAAYAVARAAADAAYYAADAAAYAADVVDINITNLMKKAISDFI